VRKHEWQRYVAPAAFLLAATIAIVLIRSGLEAGGSPSHATVSVPTTPRKRIATTSARTTTQKAKPSGARFWTVGAGDTFGVISSKSGVPVATLQQLNPKVSSTSLFIGEKIRLR
jgi:LysM repeat protein